MIEIYFEIGTLAAEIRHINLVGESCVMAVVETEHAYVDLNCRIVVEEYRQTGSKTNIEVEISLICACDIVA